MQARINVSRWACAVIFMMIHAVPLHAQTWPARSVRLIVPFAPAGTTDILARLVGENLTKTLGQPFPVENKAGAGGNIGAAEVAKAAPDGYTIMMGTPGTQAINQFLYANMPYNTEKDFAPVSFVARVPNVLVVHPSLNLKTVQDLLNLAKAKPNSLNSASPGNGTTAHLALELLKSKMGLRIQHVPFSGSAPAMQSLLAGDVQMTIDNLPPFLPQIQAGKLVALGVSTAERVGALPDVPTVASTVPGYEASSWFVIMAPAATPQPIVRRLSGEIDKLLKIPAVVDRLKSLGATAVGGTPEQLAAHLSAETAKWRDVVKASGAKIE